MPQQYEVNARSRRCSLSSARASLLSSGVIRILDCDACLTSLFLASARLLCAEDEVDRSRGSASSAAAPSAAAAEA